MKHIERFLFFVIFTLPVWAVAQYPDSHPEWQKMTSIEDLYSAYPERMDFIIQNIDLEREGLENGHLDWHHTSPENDMEYGWLHNRHGTVNTLLEAWFVTVNPKHARHIDQYVKDRIISSWPYPETKSSDAWPMWRGLEVGFRVYYWKEPFYNLMDTDYLSPATKLLILSSLPEHAHYLRNFHGEGNWLNTEISAMAPRIIGA